MYVGVEHLNPSLEQVKALGGTVDMAAHEIPGIGWIAFIRDLDKNSLGLFSVNKD